MIKTTDEMFKDTDLFTGYLYNDAFNRINGEDKDVVMSRVRPGPVRLKEINVHALSQYPHIRDTIEVFSGSYTLDNAFFVALAREALERKMLNAEELNMILPRKRKLPDGLDHNEIAHLLSHVYRFKKVRTIVDRDTKESETSMTRVKSNEYVLRYYVDNPDTPIDHGTYVQVGDDLESKIKLMNSSFIETEVKSTIYSIRTSAEIVLPVMDGHIIPTLHGMYDTKKDKLIEYSEDYINTKKIPVEFKKDMENPIIREPGREDWDVESWLLDITDGDEEVKQLIWETIAAAITPNILRNKSIWFYSDQGNNGKGTIGLMIRRLIGKDNVANLSITDYADRFKPSQLIDATINMSDENDLKGYVDSAKNYKASITGDTITVESKYEKAVNITFTGMDIQMINGLPKISDTSDSFYRRIIIVPFLKSFTNNGEKKYIKEDYVTRPEVLEYVLSKAVRIAGFEEFIVPEVAKDILGTYKISNDPVRDFWNDVREEFRGPRIPSQLVFDLYIAWFNSNNPSGSALGKINFNTAIKNILNNDDDWTYKEERAKYKADDFDDEPIISDYGLDLTPINGKPATWSNNIDNKNDPALRRSMKSAYGKNINVIERNY